MQKDFDGYLRIMKYCHGREGERTAKRFLKGEIRAPWEDQSAKYTVNKHLIDQAQAVIVHSDMSKESGRRRRLSISRCIRQISERTIAGIRQHADRAWGSKKR